MTRSTADIVADLRGFIEWYGCDPGVPMSAVDVANEAADRLTEEDRNRRFFEACHQVKMRELATIDALRPPCPTCGGTRQVNAVQHAQGWRWCRDCVDGKVSIEQLVATYNAVHGYPMNRMHTNTSEGSSNFHAENALLTYLRAVKP